MPELQPTSPIERDSPAVLLGNIACELIDQNLADVSIQEDGTQQLDFDGRIDGHRCTGVIKLGEKWLPEIIINEVKGGTVETTRFKPTQQRQEVGYKIFRTAIDQNDHLTLAALSPNKTQYYVQAARVLLVREKLLSQS